MNIYESNINGNSYLYAYDSIFIAKGKSLQKRKSLGPVSSESELSKKKEAFLRFVQEEETRLRVEYWKERLSSEKNFKYTPLEKIESLRVKMVRGRQQMGSMGVTAMNTAFLVDFIYNSNKIEGSRIPHEEVERKVKLGVVGTDEVSNTLKAIYQVDNHFQFTKPQIEKLHHTLLSHEPSKLGYRKEKVVVGNSEVTPWEEILPELQKLLNWYKKNQKTMYPPELAFQFYYTFERIHPFIDGNGRLGRLLMNKILKEHRFRPIIVWNKRRVAHESVFKKYMEGKSESFYQFMLEQMEKTYTIYLEKVENAYNLEALYKTFLAPSSYNF